jgi:hypothetical protein
MIIDGLLSFLPAYSAKLEIIMIIMTDCRYLVEIFMIIIVACGSRVGVIFTKNHPGPSLYDSMYHFSRNFYPINLRINSLSLCILGYHWSYILKKSRCPLRADRVSDFC